MIDMYSYILPIETGGTENYDESLKIVKNMINSGIRGVIATPKYSNGEYLNKYTDILKLTKNLNEHINYENIDFKVYPGQLIKLEKKLVGNFEKYDIKGLNGSRYILIELPSKSIPLDTCELLSDLRIEGYIPIITNPEKIVPIRENLKILQDFLNIGCLAQIKAESIISSDKELKKFSREMVEQNLISFLSSDSYSIKNNYLKKALAKIENLYGTKLARYYIQNSEKIIKNSIITLNYKSNSVKRRLFYIFSRNR